MIEYIKGELADLQPAYAVVDCHGVGYGLNISLNTYSAIQGKKDVKLFVHEAIREDAYALYGFATAVERRLFMQLISVSGIGGNTARMILSELSPAELCNVIATANDKMLKTVKGIGLKTAQRIIVELKDKIDMADVPAGNVVAPVAPAAREVADEAIAALTMLGFAAAASAKTVHALLKADPSLTVEGLIKQALKRL